MKTLKMLIAVLVTLTAPIWVIPFFVIGGIWESSERMYKLLWGEK